ncbi:hypothetical protein K431DRAFT_298770 [Polychaeton citri CBS 116435]|uniref:Zinc finger PHD-type domain-containing protein n=1 Tax=Polychaeton citri CBS 116435 TaxID=1314669 RepID=A0A9P4PYR0_9PEZI|nr:hypothetical protein K431DRAFT_298770 [Polychaeton citri CBS 116435]
MPSPMRRSTRGASSNGKPPPPTSTASSSSLSSAKATRVTKDHVKSATPHSLSSEDLSEAPRRSKRSMALHEDEGTRETADQDENPGDEEEVTRCICGQQEYPGPPQSEAFSAVDAQSEDAGGLFIQCDGCSVWQHGGCVGIVEESLCPDKYYCEECRPKQHDVRTDPRGQKYSLYLPLYPKIHRKSSVSKYDEKARRDRESVVSRGSTEPGKRRATMRSKEHDDEEEQLQRAIEESKRDTEGTGTGTGTGRRSGKRSRDDSEESKEAKRPRRASESTPSMTRSASQDLESEDENGILLTTSKQKKARAEATLTARNTEMREKEKMKAQERAEAAGRRQERAGRRRGDEGDQDLSEEPSRPTTKQSPPASSQASPPPPAPLPLKRGPGKRTKKLGNNQYTKARELAAAGITSSPHSKKRQLALNGAASGDEHGVGERRNSPFLEPSNGNGNGRGRHGKGKGKALNGGSKQPTSEEMENAKSIPNIRRAIEGMQVFISKTQLEMAGDRVSGGSDTPRTGGPVRSPLGMDITRDFNNLSAMEMADVISRNIHRWQSLYGSMTA